MVERMSDMPPGTIGFHISIWLILVMAGIATAVVGVIIGLPTLRLRGDYLAIVTLGFGEIMPQIARNGNNLGGFNFTGGPQGITWMARATKLFAWMIPGEARVYPLAELEDAKRWVAG